MRLVHGYRQSLSDFIIDTITEMDGIPEDISIKALRATAEKILDEVQEHLSYNLPDVIKTTLE